MSLVAGPGRFGVPLNPSRLLSAAINLSCNRCFKRLLLWTYFAIPLQYIARGSYAIPGAFGKFLPGKKIRQVPAPDVWPRQFVSSPPLF